MNPTTEAEWQDAVDAAYGARALESARAYGLVKGGPEVNTERCDQILREGRAKGIYPKPDGIERFVAELLAEQKGGEA